MSLLVPIRVLEWLALLLAVLGVALSIYMIRDFRLDRAAATDRVDRQLVGIGISHSIVSLIAHSLFGSLAIIAVTSTPRPARYGLSLWYTLTFVIIQSVMLGMQVRVLRGREQIRKEMNR